MANSVTHSSYRKGGPWPVTGALAGLGASAVLVLAFVIFGGGRRPADFSPTALVVPSAAVIFASLAAGALIQHAFVRRISRPAALVGCIVGSVLVYLPAVFLGLIIGGTLGGSIFEIVGSWVGAGPGTIPAGIAIGISIVLVAVVVIGALLGTFAGLAVGDYRFRRGGRLQT